MKKNNWIFTFGFLFLPAVYIYLDFSFIPEIQIFIYNLEMKNISVFAWNHNFIGFILYITRLLFGVCFLITSLGFILSNTKIRMYFRIPLYFLVLWIFFLILSIPYWILFGKDKIIVHTLTEEKVYWYNDITRVEEIKKSKLSTLQIDFKNEQIVIAGSDKIVPILKIIKEKMVK